MPALSARSALVTSLGLVLATLCAGTAAAEPSRAPVGPLRTDAQGRDRIRGNRPETATLYAAWVPPAHRPDAALEDALAAFERASFPESTRQTIVRDPPEPWMKALALPEVPVRWNRKTVEYLRFFRDSEDGKRMIKAWFRRLARWEPTLRRILREVGVPEDLLFVALAESGFNPAVRSSVGAAGMWQFMEPTGQVYGLRQDFWVDERHDVEKATWAAALYLKDLRARFGSWELALAAYNAGYGLVLTAIERFNTNNFWALVEVENGLPYATTNYPPKIVAAAIVGRNRKLFGCDAATLADAVTVEVAEVQVAHTTALEHVAEAVREPPALIRELNAQYVRGRTPPRPGPSRLKIPRRSLAAWQRGQEQLARLRDGESTWRVREGESLARIARRVGISEKELRAENGIRDATEAAPGVTLVIPASVATRDKASDKPEPPPLAAVPPLPIEPGTRLVFVELTRASTPGTLSAGLGVAWSKLVAWNDIDPHARLQSGLLLQALVPAGFDGESAGIAIWERGQVEHVVRGSEEHLEAELRRRGKARRGYRVRRGDTLARIASRFDLTLGDLTRINGIASTREPEPGEVLVVYVAADRVRTTEAAPPPRPRSEVPSAPAASEARPRPRVPTTAETARVPGHAPARGTSG